MWKARNAKIFQDKDSLVAAIVEESKILSWNWLRVMSKSFIYDISVDDKSDNLLRISQVYCITETTMMQILLRAGIRGGELW
ncbi:hypothetical protein TSUD_30820 [Trifolium subterraneum]|uniref:Uncharacterized protein n=1 Tax=Trifolium subterraneum TaxID=3900 RepID=A0A2Z6M3W7_TRISU|nr:hypothetical protein TSUD_30820 [Trifolium subterraneum]